MAEGTSTNDRVFNTTTGSGPGGVVARAVSDTSKRLFQSHPQLLQPCGSRAENS